MDCGHPLPPGEAEIPSPRPGWFTGVIYGLVAAAGWGVSAVAATHAARRAGTYVAVLSGQGLGVIVLL